MSLKQQIEGDIKKAMLAKDKDELRALRGIKSLILLAETDKGSTGELTPDAEMKLLQKAAKQRNDSLAIYREQGREDLAIAEEAELKVINRYLPEQMSEQDLKMEIQKIIEESPAPVIQGGALRSAIAEAATSSRCNGLTISIRTRSRAGTARLSPAVWRPPSGYDTRANRMLPVRSNCTIVSDASCFASAARLDPVQALRFE